MLNKSAQIINNYQTASDTQAITLFTFRKKKKKKKTKDLL